MLHGVGAGWPAGGRGIRELCPGQASLPAATGKIPEVRWFPAPDCSHLQRRRNQVQLQLIHLLTFGNGFVSMSIVEEQFQELRKLKMAHA